MARIDCPECGSPVDDLDFACSHCELILNPEASGGRFNSTNSSIVRALISPPDFSNTRDDIPAPPKAQSSTVHEQITVMRQVSLSGDEVPRLLADLDVALKPLHPFEAYVVSFFDGTTSAREVSLAAQLRMVEVNAVLSSLMERKLVVLDPPRKAASRPPPPRDFADDAASHEEDAMPTEPIGYAAVAEPPPAPAKPVTPRALPSAKGLPSSQQLPAVVPPKPPEASPLSTPALPVISRPVPEPVARPPSVPPGGKIPPLTRPVREIPLRSRTQEPARSNGQARTEPPVASRVTKPQSAGTRSPAIQLRPLEAAKIQDPVKNSLERAVALEKRGEVRGAIEVLKLGIARASKPAPLYNKLALILLDQRRDFGQAEDLLNKALAADPQNTIYQQNLYRVVAAAAAAAAGETGSQPAVKVDPKANFFAKLWNK